MPSPKKRGAPTPRKTAAAPVKKVAKKAVAKKGKPAPKKGKKGKKWTKWICIQVRVKLSLPVLVFLDSFDYIKWHWTWNWSKKYKSKTFKTFPIAYFLAIRVSGIFIFPQNFLVSFRISCTSLHLKSLNRGAYEKSNNPRTTSLRRKVTFPERKKTVREIMPLVVVHLQQV